MLITIIISALYQCGESTAVLLIRIPNFLPEPNPDPALVIEKYVS
jgi:hypothetical protein